MSASDRSPSFIVMQWLQRNDTRLKREHISNHHLKIRHQESKPRSLCSLNVPLLCVTSLAVFSFSPLFHSLWVSAYQRPLQPSRQFVAVNGASVDSSHPRNLLGKQSTVTFPATCEIECEALEQATISLYHWRCPEFSIRSICSNWLFIFCHTELRKQPMRLLSRHPRHTGYVSSMCSWRKRTRSHRSSVELGIRNELDHRHWRHKLGHGALDITYETSACTLSVNPNSMTDICFRVPAILRKCWIADHRLSPGFKLSTVQGLYGRKRSRHSGIKPE